ncbi:MAG TPA: cupin domain-containing protein [Chitinophagaceae bacterium]|nr:cupin domain-containing protein [Chitinophagaceae bacterium]
MKKLSALILFILSIIGLQAQDHTMTSGSHLRLNMNDLVWKDGPASLPPGAKIAIIEGDMSKPELFTIRLSLPANYKVPPHWHPAIEHVTVLKGGFYMGTGEHFDEAAAVKIAEGGFALMPIKQAHYAFTKKRTIVQLHGMGPWGINYINPADDPRKK